MSNNKLTDLSCLDAVTKLEVLNAASNSIPRIFGLERLGSLKALILNNNQIKNIRNLEKCPELNTIVVSDNKIEELSGIQHSSKLIKLSAAKNKIRVIPEDLAKNMALTELRLNSNKIATLPSSLQLNKKLKLLDVGNNRISKMDDLQVLGDLPNLTNLNLLGNPIHTQLAENPEDYREKMTKLIPTLEILDGKRLEKKVYKYHNEELKIALGKRQKLAV